MMITLFTSCRVTIGTPEYHREREAAERLALAATPRGHCRWQDDYNDYSATGRFVVTGRV